MKEANQALCLPRRRGQMPPTSQLEHLLKKVIALLMYRNAFRLKRRSVLLTTGVAWSFV